VLIPPTALDEPSGNAAVNGVPVSVTPVRSAEAVSTSGG